MSSSLFFSFALLSALFGNRIVVFTSEAYDLNSFCHPNVGIPLEYHYSCPPVPLTCHNTQIACGNWTNQYFSCRVITNIRLIHSLVDPGNSTLVDLPSCTSTSYLSSYQCNIECLSNSTTPCTGSSVFCNDFLSLYGKNCSNAALCNCTVLQGYSLYELTDHLGVTIMSNEVNMTTGLLCHPSLEHQLLQEITSPNNISIHFDQISQITINNKDIHTILCVAHMFKNQINQTFYIHGSSKAVFNLDKRFFLTPGKLNVSCYHDLHYIESEVFILTPLEICIGATFPSLDWLKEISCANADIVFFRILILVGLALSLLAIIYFIGLFRIQIIMSLAKLFTMIMSFVMSFLNMFLPTSVLKIRVVAKVLNFLKRQISNIGYWMSKEELIIKTGSNTSNPPKPVQTERGTGVSKSWVRTFVGVIILVSAVSAECDNSFAIQGSMKTCTLTGNIKNCKLSFQSQFVMNPFVKSTCFSILDASSGNSTALHVEFELEAIQEKLTLATQYYTSDWTPKIYDNYVCQNPFSGSCRAGECPSVVNPSCLDYGHGCQTSDQAITSRPGFTACKHARHSDCFYSDACLFQRISVNPIGNKFAILKPVQKLLTPILKITAQNSEFRETLYATIVGQKFYVSNDRKVSGIINGLYQPTLSFLTERHIAVSGPNAYLVDASQRDSPLVGKVGDIQASSESLLSSFGLTNFLVAPNLVSISDGSASYAKSVLWSNLHTKFPTTFDGSVWYYTGGNLVSNVSYSQPISISINTDIPIDIFYKVSVVEVTGKFLNASGCYNCETGGKAFFSLKSKFDAGTVSVSSSDVTIVTQTIFVNISDSDFCIYFKTAHKFNSFYIDFSTPDNSQKFKIEFRAVEEVSVRNESFTVLPDNTTNNLDRMFSDGSIDFAKAFDDFDVKNPVDNLFTTGKLVTYIMVAGGAIALLSAALIAYKLFKTPSLKLKAP